MPWPCILSTPRSAKATAKITAGFMSAAALDTMTTRITSDVLTLGQPAGPEARIAADFESRGALAKTHVTEPCRLRAARARIF